MKTKAKAVCDDTSVEWSSRVDFPVRFTRDVLSPQNPALLETLRRHDPLRPQRVLVALDSGAVACHPRLPGAVDSYVRQHKTALRLAAAPLVVEGGESAKDRAELVEWLRARLIAAAVEGPFHLVVAGGGSLLDAAGFAAATVARPPRVTRVPTTLVSQISSTAATRCHLNALGRKNALGAPGTPFAALVDPKWLATLPERQKRAGMLEACRAALGGDANFFHWIVDHSASLGDFDRRSLETLARWGARVQWETAPGALPSGGGPLPFAHWAASWLEIEAGGDLLYGEAAGLALALDLLLSVLLTGLPPEAARAALEVLADLRAPLWHDALAEAGDEDEPALLSALDAWRDGSGCAAIPLLNAWGCARPCTGVSAEAVAASIEALRRWNDRDE